MHGIYSTGLARRSARSMTCSSMSRGTRCAFCRWHPGVFSGSGPRSSLMPVDAVYINQTLERIARFPRYYLALMDERYVSDIMGNTATCHIGSRDYQYPLYLLLPASHVRPRHISKAGKPSAKGSLWSPPSLPPVGRRADLHRAKSSPPERLALMLGHVAMDRPVMVPPSRCSGH